jgi:sugar phosphate isomerase/epimerase
MGRAISLAALTVLEARPIAAVRIAARCGYSHVGLRPVAATDSEPHVPILTDPAARRELLAVLAGEGITVLDCEIVRLLPETDWDLMERAVEFTTEFGSARLLVADNDPEPARSADSLARLAALAAPLGVTPCLEFMPWTSSPNLAAARQRIAGTANAALLIDAFHLARSGGSPSDLDPDDRVSYLQLCDIAGQIPPLDAILREARADRLFPGEGEIDLAGLLQRLPGLPVSLEVPADRLRDAGASAEARAHLAITATRRVLAAIGHD